MWESAEALDVSDEARRMLEGWIKAPTSPQRIVMRAKIVLMAAEGMSNRRIAHLVGTSRPTVSCGVIASPLVGWMRCWRMPRGVADRLASRSRK